MIHRDDLPSVSAILLADLGVEDAVRRVDLALGSQRYDRWDRALPAGYPAGRHEWVGWSIAALEGGRLVAAMPHDPGSVFELARWLSAAAPDELIVAWQRLRGGGPVAKFLVGGAPRWKDGEDADREVDWHVPFAPPAEMRLPPRRGLPDGARAAEVLLDGVVRPFPRDMRPAPGGRVVAYLERRSPLA